MTRFEKLQKAFFKKEGSKYGVFKISKSSVSDIEGVHVVEKLRHLTITNLDGGQEIVEHSSYERKNFRIDAQNKILIVWNSGRSAKQLVNALSYLSQYNLVFELLSVGYKQFEKWAALQYTTFKVSKVLTDQWNISDSTKGRFEIVSNGESIDFELIQSSQCFLNKAQVVKKEYTLSNGYDSSILTIASTGSIKCVGGLDILNDLTPSLEALIVKAK